MTERLLRFLFAEADDAASQLSFVVDRIEAKLASAAAAKGEAKDPWIEIDGQRIETFDELVEALTDAPGRGREPGRPLGAARRRRHRGRFRTTASRGRAARRRTSSAGKDVGKRDAHLLDWRRKQMSVVDIHALHDRAKRFVVGAVLKRMFEEKESLGHAAAPRLRRPRRAEQVRPAGGEGPDQGGAARHLGARPEPRHRPPGRAADGLRGRGPHRGERRAPGGGPARRGRGRAARVRLPHRGGAGPGRDPEAGHHDRPAARDPRRRCSCASRSRPGPRARARWRRSPAPTPSPGSERAECASSTPPTGTSASRSGAARGWTSTRRPSSRWPGSLSTGRWTPSSSPGTSSTRRPRRPRPRSSSTTSSPASCPSGSPASSSPGNHDHPRKLAALATLLERLRIHVRPEVRPPDQGGVVRVPRATGRKRRGSRSCRSYRSEGSWTPAR